MWRHYIRFRDGNIENCSPPDRANWQACDIVFHRLPTQSQTVVQLYYQKPDAAAVTDTLFDYCDRTKMTRATVWKIIRSAQTLAAEQRGLIPPRDTRSQHTQHFDRSEPE